MLIFDTVRRETPHYIRSHSLKSSSASDEYFSHHGSDAASQKSDDSKASYETPPSRISTPTPLLPTTAADVTLPPTRNAAVPAPLEAADQDQDLGKTETSTMDRVLSSLDDISPPTPGADDTPYIHFALEQLTRDEDVLGHGRHSTASPADFSPAPIVPTARSVSALSQNTSAPSPPPSTPPSAKSPSPPQPLQIQRKPVPQEFMIPVDLSKDLRSRLGYVPRPLRLYMLLLYLALSLLMIAALLFNLVFVSAHHGLYDYDGTGTPRYFVFQYLPQLLGILLILWLFVIEAAIYRCLPYFCMTQTQKNAWALQNMRILPANYLVPDLQFFRNGDHLLGLAFLLFWLTNFTVPLLSCLFQTQWITGHGPARFRWTTVRGVGWTLVALYILHCLALFYCGVRFRRRRSNLLWDPCSLADMICLFRRSNVGVDFEQTEVSPEPNRQIAPRNLRLAFWTTTERPDVFHAVGEEYAPLKRLSMPPPTQPDKAAEILFRPNETVDVEANQRLSYGSAFSRNIHSPFVRYRWTPWYLRDSAVLAWIIVAVLLLLAFLVVSFVNRAVQDGFQPRLPSLTRSDGFSPSNFLYSFLPALLGMILFLMWQPIAMYFRAVQPFCNLSAAGGADARHSLLLSYPAHGPLGVIIRALLNGDYKVAYVCFISLVAMSLPVLAGGVFTAQFFSRDGQVRIVASMPGYIALTVLVAVYALSYLVVWPTRKRYLPHTIHTIADLMSWLYASPLLGERLLQHVTSKEELVQALMDGTTSPTGLTGDSTAEMDEKPHRRPRRDRSGGTGGKFAFGVFIGRDGKEHLGIDRLQRPGSREMLVLSNHQA